MGNSDSSIVYVRSFADRFSASVASEMLESHGIKTMLTGMISSGYFYMTDIRLYVSPADYDEAVKLLDEHGDR